VQGGKIRVVPVATGLYHPWSLAFPDACTILVAERNGRLRMIRDSVLLPEPVWTSPTASGITGDALHFIALHPNFAQNRWVYVSYPKKGERGITLAVARGRLDGTKLTDVQEIFVADAGPAHAWLPVDHLLSSSTRANSSRSPNIQPTSGR
jgi:glucose/arabinose dehydrogenase